MKERTAKSAVSLRMAAVRQKNTHIESRVGTVLRELGVHYRKNVKVLPGSPDFSNQSGGWAVFANGCFWHHHTGCRRATVRKTNATFWNDKFRANRHRDASAVRKLRKSGYRVVVVWE